MMMDPDLDKALTKVLVTGRIIVDNVLEDLITAQSVLMRHVPHKHVITEESSPRVVAALGIIEETLEYLRTVGVKDTHIGEHSRKEQLDELTDILFFVLELFYLSGFDAQEIISQYVDKALENYLKWKKRIEVEEESRK